MTTSINEEKNTSREIDTTEVNDFTMVEETLDGQNSQTCTDSSLQESGMIDHATESIDVIVKDAFIQVCDELSPTSLVEKLQRLLSKRL